MTVLKLIKIAAATIVILTGLMAVIVFFYMQQNKFGKSPDKKRIEQYSRLSNFKDGKFQNISITPELTEGYSMAGLIYAQYFKKAPRRKPTDSIPSIKIDLHNLPVDDNVLVWFGHSSYFIQIDGKRILVDPVFSGNASPVPGTNKAFKGTDSYVVTDLPTIDYLFISHDHYDHLDYETIVALKEKVKKVVCGLGVGSHFEHWGYSPTIIEEGNWYESIEFDSGFIAHYEPARHFSGRGFTKNTTLWASYVLQTPSMKIYIGGDSGYDTHFADIGKRHGNIDLAILDNGQYDVAWRYIHTLPDEVLRAAQDLNAKRIFPVHSSKFVLANHPWDEPLQRISKLNRSTNIPLVTPIIGEIVNLNDTNKKFEQWWTGVN